MTEEERRRTLTFVVVGAGPTGVGLCPRIAVLGTYARGRRSVPRTRNKEATELEKLYNCSAVCIRIVAGPARHPAALACLMMQTAARA